MKTSAWLSLPLTIGLLVASAIPQARNNFPKQPEPLGPKAPEKPPAISSKHIDLAQLQKEANDLASTAQTIPFDIASVRKGMLPKDVIKKLKQIEKLSKHLRGELNP